MKKNESDIITVAWTNMDAESETDKLDHTYPRCIDTSWLMEEENDSYIGWFKNLEEDFWADNTGENSEIKSLKNSNPISGFTENKFHSHFLIKGQCLHCSRWKGNVVSNCKMWIHLRFLLINYSDGWQKKKIKKWQIDEQMDDRRKWSDKKYWAYWFTALFSYEFSSRMKIPPHREYSLGINQSINRSVQPRINSEFYARTRSSIRPGL